MGRLRSVSTNDAFLTDGCPSSVKLLCERRDSNGLRRRFHKFRPPDSGFMRPQCQEGGSVPPASVVYSLRHVAKVLLVLVLCALLTVFVVLLWLHQFYPAKLASVDNFDAGGRALVQRHAYNRPILHIHRGNYYYGDSGRISRFADPLEHLQTHDLLQFDADEEPTADEIIPHSGMDAEVLATVEKAVEYRQSGKLGKARRLLEHALALSPNNADVLTEFGLFLESAGDDLVAADNMFTRALSASPQHGTALVNRMRTSPLVESMDQRMLTELDRKRAYFLHIPRSSAALRRAMRDAYFAHVYHTVALEGNSMDLGQTRSVLETRMAVAGKSVVEHNEILGMDAALRYLNSTLVDRVGTITMDDILQLHRRVLGHVDPVQAGVWRTGQVYVGRFTPPPAGALHDEVDAFVQWLNDDATLSIHPVELAALAHYKLVYIHPFVDGNGRVSRLVMNAILMHAGFPPVILPVHERLRYYETLRLANDGDLRPFIRFVARATDATLQGYIDAATSMLPSTVGGQFDARNPRIISDERLV